MRRALVVGIDDYPSCPLTGCVNDAVRLATVLEFHHDGRRNFDCDVLRSDKHNITRPLLRERITRLFDQPAEIAFFHFSGHGTINGLGGYLVTPDFADFDVGIPMSGLLALANQTAVKEVFITLDCCHSGDVSAASVYAYIDNAMGAWDARPLFKANVDRFAKLREAAPTIDLALLRQLPEYFPLPAEELALSPDYEPDAEPHNPTKEAIFGNLQKLCRAGLVEPVGEQHMYHAAMNAKACALTRLGKYYWRLINEKKL